ncbi:hypothetical protein GCM10023238_21920 [Streptomyces heliomycini]
MLAGAAGFPGVSGPSGLALRDVFRTSSRGAAVVSAEPGQDAGVDAPRPAKPVQGAGSVPSLSSSYQPVPPDPGVEPVREAGRVEEPGVVGVARVGIEEEDGGPGRAAVRTGLHAAAPVGYGQHSLGPGPAGVLAAALVVGEVLGHGGGFTGGCAVQQGRQSVLGAESAVRYAQLELVEQRGQGGARRGLGTCRGGRVDGGRGGKADPMDGCCGPCPPPVSATARARSWVHDAGRH